MNKKLHLKIYKTMLTIRYFEEEVDKFYLKGKVGQVSSQFMQAIKWLVTGRVEAGSIIIKTFPLDEARKAFKALRECVPIKIVFKIE